MLSLQAILLTSSLLIVVGMVASVSWLAAVNVRREAVAVRAEALDEPV